MENPDSTLLHDLSEFRVESSFINLPELNPEVLIYPNPFNDYLDFEISNLAPEKVKIKIFNLLNEEVISNTWDYSKENNNLRINLSQLDVGFYIVNVSNGKDFNNSYKFVKQ